MLLVHVGTTDKDNDGCYGRATDDDDVNLFGLTAYGDGGDDYFCGRAADDD